MSESDRPLETDGTEDLSPRALWKEKVGNAVHSTLFSHAHSSRTIESSPTNSLHMQLSAIARQDRICFSKMEPDDDLFLIISGDFAISVNGRRVATRGSGLHVGEMALLDPTSQRSATVTALREAVVAEISRSSFKRIANKNPAIWQRLALQLAKRLIQRNALIATRHERSQRLYCAPAGSIALSGTTRG